MTQPNLSAALPGVAIATALMPPLCTIGIGLALSRWDVAGGAALLFITNTVTIAFASVLVFFLRGFSSGNVEGEQRLPRSLLFSASLTVLLLVPLTFYSVKFFRDAAENRYINQVVATQIQNMNGAELVELKTVHDGDALDLSVTIRTSSALQYQQVVALQEAIVKEINHPVSLKVDQVFAERLDPLVPPTSTPTPTNTSTFTPGPSPTATDTPIATPTGTPTALPTATPTIAPTVTPLPAQAKVVVDFLPQLKIYQSPGGPQIGALYPGQILTVSHQTTIVEGIVWAQVTDADGRIGWVPQIYLQFLTLTPTPTASQAPTGTSIPSALPSSPSSATRTTLPSSPPSATQTPSAAS